MNETTSSTKKVLTLTHNQQVRVPALRYASKIVILTLSGFYAEHRAKYGNVERDFPHATEEGLEWLKKAEAMTIEDYDQDQRNKGGALPTSMQSPSVLCADYPGKAERLAKERAEEAAAPVLEDGQVVEIDGKLWTVKVGRVGTCDPVHFFPVL